MKVCNQCNNQVQDNAISCPYCGCIGFKPMAMTGGTVNCLKCGHLLEPGVKFCRMCGNKVENVQLSSANMQMNTPIQNSQINKCANCGENLNVGAKFCRKCGKNVMPQAVKPTVPAYIENFMLLNMNIDDNLDREVLYKRAFLYLEEGKNNEAYTYFEHFLNKNPEDAKAYFGKLMLNLGYKTEDDFKKLNSDIRENLNYKRTLRYADDEFKAKLTGYANSGVFEMAKNMKSDAKTADDFRAAKSVFESLGDYEDSQAQAGLCENLAWECLYQNAVTKMNNASSEGEFKACSSLFDTLKNYKNSSELSKKCLDKAEEARKDTIYNQACLIFNTNRPMPSMEEVQQQISVFKSLSGWRDSEGCIQRCNELIKQIEEYNEAERLKAEQSELERLELEKKKKKRKFVRKLIIILICLLLLAGGAAAFVIFYYLPSSDYDNAVAIMNEQNYDEAVAEFEKLNGFKDSEDMIDKCLYEKAVGLMEEEKYNEAIEIFEELEEYEDSTAKSEECEKLNTQLTSYNEATELVKSEKYEEAMKIFSELSGFKDSDKKYKECDDKIKQGIYDEAEALFNEKKYEEAKGIFASIPDYKDSVERHRECDEMIKQGIYDEAEELYNKKKYEEAKEMFASISDYKDSQDKYELCVKKIEEELKKKTTTTSKKDNKTTTTTTKNGVPDDYICKGKVIIDDGFLNVRDVPSISGEVVDVLYNDDEIYIIDFYGDWYYIKLGKIEGYVSNEFVQLIFD